MNQTPPVDFAHQDPRLSVEFFPPKSEKAAEQLLQTADALKALKPDFASITYGAGGSTRSRTLEYARRLQDMGYHIMPHLTCVGHARQELKNIIAEFKAAGVNQIMALRGDPPIEATDYVPHPDGLRYANELVSLIQQDFPECTIAVAGYPEKHPQAPDLDTDLKNLKRKVEAGASFITTQLFFDNSVYFNFVERCRAIDIQIPILPGLLTLTSLEQAQRFCSLCEAHLPHKLQHMLDQAGEDPTALEAVGLDWIYLQARELLQNHAPGLHLYLLNRSSIAIQLVQRLKADGLLP
ncbi:MAG: 5,10-methylenetetrahydrofolate reductase [Opitutia bacterium UBA7350]|nr:MAG: 5,10-methylenetetrahydrofolate reductase [Opitutae bacterium UBA7350]